MLDTRREVETPGVTPGEEKKRRLDLLDAKNCREENTSRFTESVISQKTHLFNLNVEVRRSAGSVSRVHARRSGGSRSGAGVAAAWSRGHGW